MILNWQLPTTPVMLQKQRAFGAHMSCEAAFSVNLDKHYYKGSHQSLRRQTDI